MLGAPSEALPTEGMLTEHFKKSEFICECKGKKCNGYNGISDTELKKTAEFLEGFRSAVGGKAITLNSGVRCPSANKAAGGSDGSQHLYGRAADIKVSGMAQSAVDKAALAYCRGLKYGGVGYQAKGFTHLDRRNEASKPGIVTWLY